MNGVRIALVAMVAACAWAAWPKHEVIIDRHVTARQSVIQSTLGRVENAVVVLGDSIVEASTLPRSLCGHPIVNAGIGRASTESRLGSMLAESLDGKRAALIVVSLGTNDAVIPSSVERYRSSYRALLTELAALAPRTAVVQIPSPEGGSEEAGKLRLTIDSYNAILPGLAEQAGATFIALPAMPERYTLDGIHLNTAGYEIWDRAILRGIESAICKIT
jgi:GDSL-like Lipase/Acylhydrolase family